MLPSQVNQFNDRKEKPSQFIKLDARPIADLRIWLNFLDGYNAKHIIRSPVKVSSKSLHMYTDSSRSGFGGVLGCNYICGLFPESWQSYSIQLLEMYPIFPMMHTFAPKLARCHVTFHCDNSSVVYNLNAQTSKNPKIMTLNVQLSCLL